MENCRHPQKNLLWMAAILDSSVESVSTDLFSAGGIVIVPEKILFFLDFTRFDEQILHGNRVQPRRIAPWIGIGWFVCSDIIHGSESSVVFF